MDFTELRKVRKELVNQAEDNRVILKMDKDYVYLLVKLDSGGYRIYGYDKRRSSVEAVGSSNRGLIYLGLENYFSPRIYPIRIICNENETISKSFICIVKEIMKQLSSYTSGYYRTGDLFDVFRYNYKFIANLVDLYPWGETQIDSNGYKYTRSIYDFLRNQIPLGSIEDPKESNLKKVLGLNPKAIRFLIDNLGSFNRITLKSAIAQFGLDYVKEHASGFNRLNSTYWHIKGAIEFIEKLSWNNWWYNDYLRMKGLLPPELSKDFPYIPSCSDDVGFREKHDEIMETYRRWQQQQRLAAQKELNDNYEKNILPKVKAFEYANEKYSIIACKELKELVDEGSALGHCVGSYTDSVGHGREYILFLRKNEDLKKPFYTVNITVDNKIRQIHGKSNCNVTKEVGKFVTKWAKQFKLNASNYSGCLCHL